ncbi:MAG: GGDEF domain-containing protein [Oscillibacter sp.]|jgi:diguanylate cyclase (GGDEF)-like protein|nr:GGDEF domain-containing protein [Oscillibacter sp.]
MTGHGARRKRIGLLISHLASNYAYERCLGVERAAEEADCDVYIFPGTLMQDFLGSDKGVSFNFSHNLVFEYAPRLNLDALIICIAGIADYYDHREFQSFLGHFAGIPIILLEFRIPGYRSIVSDSRSGITAVLEHLISVHHTKKICYVSGPDNNYDAQERLATYREVMARHQLPVTPEMVVCGWFSIHCEKEINQLLDDNPDADAICCANDLMAVCTCQELKRRGMIPGRDIAVTGFDNSDLSKTLDPPLTTVRVSSYDMGYQAVQEVLRLLRGEEQKIFVTESGMIARTSCGCTYQAGFGQFLDRFLPLTPQVIPDVCRQILALSLLHPSSASFTSRSQPVLQAFLSSLLADALDVVVINFQSDAQLARVRSLVAFCATELSAERLQNTLDVFFACLSRQIEDPVRQIRLLEFRIYVRQTLFDCMMRSLRQRDSQEQESGFCATHLIRNALFHSGRTTEALQEICENLIEMGIRSAFLYTYPYAIPIKQNGKWRCAEEMTLSACFSDQKVTIPLEGESVQTADIPQQISAHLDGRRCTMLVFCLITEQEQNGFLLCESDLSLYFNTYVASMQIGAVLKFFSLLEQRTSMEAQLRQALKVISHKTEMLEVLSSQDVLTKTLNRRGFLEQMQSRILASFGDTLLLGLMDLDNLKSINDSFGHKEGDYALCRFAEIVRNVLGEDDIFGRFGGDEFILLSSHTDACCQQTIRQKLNQAFDDFNVNSEKPYFVEASYGFLIFSCNENATLEPLLADVDHLLYADKKKKRHSAIKPT